MDDLDNIEANLVAEAANRLSVGEFQFFQLAYHAWYGEEADPKLLERDFLAYMHHDKVPPWVRQHARNIIKRDDAGQLDSTDAIYHRFDRGTRTPGYSIGGFTKAAMVLVFAMVFMGTILWFYQQEYPGDKRCYFPPCHWLEELKPIPLP